MSIRLFVLLLLVFPAFSWAGKYPLITSIDVQIVTGGADYYITYGAFEIGPASEQVLRQGYIVELAHKHTIDGGKTFVAEQSQGTAISADSVKTIGELAMSIYPPKSNVVHHFGTNGFTECVAYVAIWQVGTPDWSTAIRPGGCLNIPPADQWCKITTPEIILEHGNLTLKGAEGSVATSSMGVECTTETAVTFNLITNDKYIYLDEGKSEITVANQPLNEKVDLKEGASVLPVRDLLTGVTTEGVHTGSSVLVMAPY